MSDIAAFFQANIIPVYFFYGLVHFITGIAVALESGRASQLRLSRALPFLAAFGLTQGINEWVAMLSMISAEIPQVAREPQWAEYIKLGWTALSFLFLFEFGRRLLPDGQGEPCVERARVSDRKPGPGVAWTTAPFSRPLSPSAPARIPHTAGRLACGSAGSPPVPVTGWSRKS